MYEEMAARYIKKTGNIDPLRKIYEKYVTNFDAMVEKISKMDFANEILAPPLITAISADDKKLLKKILIKTLPIDSINAHSIKVNDSEYLVVLNERLLSLIYTYQEIQFVSAQKYLKGERDCKFSKYYSPLIDCYLTPNSNKTLPVFDLSYLSMQLRLMIGYNSIAKEQFVLAHELAHIFLNHFDEADKKTFKEKEFEADIQALRWMANIVEHREIPIELSTCVEIFMLFHLIECNLGFPDKDATHPASIERLTNIYQNCGDVLSNEDKEFIGSMIMNACDIDSFIIE